MEFDIGKGFKIEDGTVQVALADLTDRELIAARAELDAVGQERGLWTPAAEVGTIAVETEVEVPAIRDRLLATAKEGAGLYAGAISAINTNRKAKDRIPVLSSDEYHERAKDWLTDRRVTAAGLLPTSNNRPLLVIPRLNRAITAEENVEAWRSGANGNLWPWKGRMKFLANWSDNELSGFEPEIENETVFEIVPTAYDKAREGTVAEQKEELKTLRGSYPEVNVAAIFNGAVLARRYLDKPRQWQDSYVRGIILEPARVDGIDYVPNANVNLDGNANVDGSRVHVGCAARLLVR